MEKDLNFCSAGIFPYYFSKDEKITFLFERKSGDYIPPFFNNSIGPLGGNMGNSKDKSPEEVLERELKEEFHVLYEDEESLNELIGQEILQEHHVSYKLDYDEKIIEDIKRMPSVLLEGKAYAGSYLVRFFPPLAGIKKEIKGIESTFIKELSQEEYFFVDNLLKKTGGRITTDNLKFGGKTLFVSLDDINENKYKFSWNCGQTISDLLKKGKVPMPGKYPLAIRTLENIQIEPIPTTTNPTFKEFESMGLIYKGP